MTPRATPKKGAVLTLLVLVSLPVLAQWTRVDSSTTQLCERETGELFDTGYSSRSWASAVCATLNRVEEFIGASLPEAQAQLLVGSGGVNGNAPPAPGGGGSLAEDLTDNFDDDSIDTVKWDVTALDFNAAVTVAESGGRITITPLTSTAGLNFNGLTADDPQNLTGSQVAVQVVEVPVGAGGDAELTFALDTSNTLRVAKDGTQLYFTSLIGGVSTFENVAYSGQTHRCWRIRHATSDDTINYETSADCASTWTTHRTIGRPFAITALEVGIRAGTSASNPSPGQAVFDNFNIALAADTTAPATPAMLSAVAQSASSIQTDWADVTDTDSQTQVVSGNVEYIVRRDTTPVYQGAVSSFLDTGLTANTMYDYTFAAIDDAGNESAQSAIVSETTLAGGGGASGGTAALGWTAPSAPAENVPVTFTTDGTFNFGAQGPAVKMYTDGRGKSNGQAVSTSDPSVGSWFTSEATTYVSSDHPNSSASLRAISGDDHFIQVYSNSGAGFHGREEFTEVFFAWSSRDTTDTFPARSTGQRNVKEVWMMLGNRGDNTAAGGTNHGHDLYIPGISGTGLSAKIAGNETATTWFHTVSNWDFDGWNRHAFCAKLNSSTPYGAADIAYFETLNLNGRVTPAYSGSLMSNQTAEGVSIAAWDRVKFASYYYHQTGDERVLDDIYVATGAGACARVELTNASTKGASTKSAVAVATSWGASSITATVKAGVLDFAVDDVWAQIYDASNTLIGSVQLVNN